jgi:hypothetical protein
VRRVWVFFKGLKIERRYRHAIVCLGSVSNSVLDGGCKRCVAVEARAARGALLGKRLTFTSRPSSAMAAQMFSELGSESLQEVRSLLTSPLDDIFPTDDHEAVGLDISGE